MNILMLTPEAFGGYGGIAKYNRDFINALCQQPNIQTITVYPRKRTFEFLRERLDEKIDYKFSALGGKINFFKALLKALFSKNKYDLIVCGHINLVPLAYFIAKIKKIPLYLMVYGIDVWQPTKNIIVNHCAKKIDGFISISEITEKKFKSWLGNKPSFILPNAIDLNEFTPGAKKIELIQKYHLENKKIMMTLGRLDASERYKGFDEVLNLMPLLLKKYPNLIYMIIGDGNDKERLQTKAKNLSVENSVIFTGYIEENEKADYYRLADLFVMPGRGEGFGYVYLEALACGVPAIGSKLDGSREALREGELGALVDPDDPDEIENAILMGLQKPIGVVPEGIAYFEFQNFSNRLGKVTDTIEKEALYK